MMDAASEEGTGRATPSDGKTGAEVLHEKSLLPITADLEEANQSPPTKDITYLHGWRLHLLTLAVSLCVFLANMEVSIVSTSLVTITNGFHSFDRNSWIVSAYLVTYTGFLIVWAKLSDIFGRKWSLFLAVLIFISFSGGCGAAQSMNQLIICRTFQGIGASGAFSLSTIVCFEMVPRRKYPLYGGVIFAIVALATLSGPLIGGAIDTNTTWRWIFLLNVPSGLLVMCLLLMIMPTKFPYHGSLSASPPILSRITLRQSLRKVDFVGAFLLLSACLLVVTALLETSTLFSWNSPATICLLVLSGLLWIGFFFWEWLVSRRNSSQEPMFPWRFVRNRVWMGMLLVSFLVGIPSTIITIDIPQRFQAINGDSPLHAGIRLLPYTVVVPLGSLMANAVAGMSKIPPIIFLFVGSVLQVLGLALMLTTTTSGNVPPSQYGYEAIMAFGVGVTFSILVLATPHAVESKDLAVATGAVVQFRMTGAAIGLAVATSVMNSYLTSRLSSFLSTTQLKMLLQDISVTSSFPLPLQHAVDQVLGQVYSLHIKILIGLASVQVVATLLIYRKPQLSVH